MTMKTEMNRVMKEEPPTKEEMKGNEKTGPGEKGRRGRGEGGRLHYHVKE